MAGSAMMSEDTDMQPLPSFTTAPDLLAPVHAFRDWRISAEGLRSPRTGEPWPGRVLAAQCRPRSAESLLESPHRAPGQECACGIHAYFQPSRETSRVDYSGVTGIVTVWGQLAIHEGGLRAEFARVEALSIYSRWTRRKKSLVRDVASELGVDVVDLDELEAAAHRYATPVPAGLIPVRQRTRLRRPDRPTFGSPRLVTVEP